MPALPTLVDRFRGCLLGQAVGDALGAPFETMPADAIYYGFGSVRKILANPPVEVLQYTDDTQMMIGVAEVLVEYGKILEDELMGAFVENFDAGRAYGPGTHRLIEIAAKGDDWRTAARTMFPGGSFGNGSAMRAAPVGLAFHDDLDRVSYEAELSSVPTHAHPIAIDGTRAVAVAVAVAMWPGDFKRQLFYDEILRHTCTQEFKEAISRIADLSATDYLGALGTSVEAHRSVPTAIACFVSHPDSYTEAIARAITLGGDVDTLAAIAGAISGARLGAGAIPQHLLAMLENSGKGREYIDTLAGRLHGNFTSGVGRKA
jgi:poly(ADP-ribose) glycohydrolase ARH3